MNKANKLNLDSFRKDGYIILKGVVDLNIIKGLYITAVSLLGKYAYWIPASTIAELAELEPWVNQPFNDHLLSLRKSHPELFGVLYDTIQLSIPINQVCVTPVLADTIAYICGDLVNNIAVSGHMLRMDPPFDTRNTLDWHQDSSYYEQNEEGDNGLVLWIPMVPVNEANGAIVVCPGSHKEGRLSIPSSGKADELISEQFVIPQEYLDKYPKVQVEASPGDAVVFTMDLFHKSGTNSSDGLRFVVGCRYHKMIPDDFLSGKLLYKANRRVGRMSEYKKLVTPS